MDVLSKANLKKIKLNYSKACSSFYSHYLTFTYQHQTLMLFALGFVTLACGLTSVAIAQDVGIGDPNSTGDTRIGVFACRLIQLIEGNLGALIMIVAGLGTVISAALGSYGQALSLLVVACASFTLRSFVRMFFGYNGATVLNCGNGGGSSSAG
ncbi:hypothetical protein JNK13_05415 [bacterium]|nr:hypothetical protein [bacterium]